MPLFPVLISECGTKEQSRFWESSVYSLFCGEDVLFYAWRILITTSWAQDKWPGVFVDEVPSASLFQSILCPHPWFVSHKLMSPWGQGPGGGCGLAPQLIPLSILRAWRWSMALVNDCGIKEELLGCLICFILNTPWKQPGIRDSEVLGSLSSSIPDSLWEY